MGIFSKNNKKGGFMDEIRCDEKSYLVWKWRPEGTRLGESYRENSIRYGSSLRVNEGEIAVFVYNKDNENFQDFIIGPYDKIIKTNNFPVLASIVGLAYEGGTPFQAEIYFINMAKLIQIKFAVPFFDIFDPRFNEIGVPVSIRGSLNFKIADYKEFIKLHRLREFNLNEFKEQISDSVIRYTKNAIYNVLNNHNIPLVQIETKISQINDMIEEQIKERLEKDFGIFVNKIDISAIELDKTSSGYCQLMSITKDIDIAKITAKANAQIKDIEEKQKVELVDYEEKLRIQREEGQYEKHLKNKSNNIGNIGNNIIEVIKNFKNMNKSNDSDIPNIPSKEYYIVENDKSLGPFNIVQIEDMIKKNKIQKETLVWKKGMENWRTASLIEEIKILFSSIPPIPKI